MEEQWLADRMTLRTLLRTKPSWTIQDLAQAIGRSRSWIKTWRRRLREAPPDDAAVLRSRSRARHHPPPSLDQRVIDRILEIRDQPPEHLHRTPGPKTILYYLARDPDLLALGLRLPRSTRTIYRILRHYGCIAQPAERHHTPVERPAPMTVWQLDFKDASSVPADPDGKQQHVVEVLNTVDAGSSVLVSAQVRDDFTAETTLVAVAETLREQGLPRAVMFDRDVRFVGSTRQRDCPAPFVRFWLCLGVAVTVLPPRRPDLNCFVERYHRTFDAECLRVSNPTTLAEVREVTAQFQHHYNVERPHQGLACGNQPPQLALAARASEIPPQVPLPAMVDPDRWVQELDGRRFVRKVGRDTQVSVDDERYYISQALVGKSVSLRVDAAAGEFVVEYQDVEVKRVPIKGLGSGPLPFEAYLARICGEARTDRFQPRTFGRQLALPLAA